jgi:hypothetical protein
MVINFKICKINRGVCKLTRIPTLIKKKHQLENSLFKVILKMELILMHK